MRATRLRLASAALALWALPPSAQNSHAEDLGCQGTICLSYRGERQQYDVHLRAKTETSHFNVRSPCINRGRQFELTPAGEHRFSAGAQCQFSAQACKRSNIPFVGTTRSTCGTWGTWTLRAPEGPVIDKKVICKDGFCATVTLQERPPGYGSGKWYVVYATLTHWPASNHRNVRCPDGRQTEHKEKAGVICAGTFFSVQACNRKTFGSSRCTGWSQIP